MDIKTKFNVGDEVYSIRFDDTSGRYDMERITIAEIIIITNRTGTHVRYSTKMWGVDSRTENDLFTNHLDCLAACEKKNGVVNHGR